MVTPVVAACLSYCCHKITSVTKRVVTTLDHICNFNSRFHFILLIVACSVLIILFPWNSHCHIYLPAEPVVQVVCVW